MRSDWEYKVITLKAQGGALKRGQTPEDDQMTTRLNREGAVGCELVNAICAGPLYPVTVFQKRPRSPNPSRTI